MLGHDEKIKILKGLVDMINGLSLGEESEEVPMEGASPEMVESPDVENEEGELDEEGKPKGLLIKRMVAKVK
jgi:hypothetical protein